MILADTSIWIDFFRSKMPHLRQLLNANQVIMHPFIVGELALRSLSNRQHTLRMLDEIPHIRVVPLQDVRHMIEARKLHTRGIELTDANLLASCLTTPGTLLWSADARLCNVAESLGIKADIP
jgi:predicted nucleic acid-binding protein